MKAPRYGCTEAEWQAFVTDCLDLGGWKWHHETDSRKSKAGFPDLIAVKGEQMLALELKTERGRLRPEQTEWLLALSRIPGCRAGVVRPQSWRMVMDITGVSSMVESVA